jgi:hypothetical protein
VSETRFAQTTDTSLSIFGIAKLAAPQREFKVNSNVKNNTAIEFTLRKLLPLQGEGWDGDGLRLINSDLVTQRKPIPTLALPLKGRGFSHSTLVSAYESHALNQFKNQNLIKILRRFHCLHTINL